MDKYLESLIKENESIKSCEDCPFEFEDFFIDECVFSINEKKKLDWHTCPLRGQTMTLKWEK